MRRLLALAALFSLVFADPGQAQQRQIDWNALTTETVNALSEYIKVNTIDPPGNELQAARFLKRILDKEGIESQILDTAELKPAGRANGADRENESPVSAEATHFRDPRRSRAPRPRRHVERVFPSA